jgi:hypothetical protein
LARAKSKANRDLFYVILPDIPKGQFTAGDFKVEGKTKAEISILFRALYSNGYLIRVGRLPGKLHSPIYKATERLRRVQVRHSKS